MRGEELHGLSIEELQYLEKSLEVGLSRVTEKKGEKIMNEITLLQEKVCNYYVCILCIRYMGRD